MTSGLTWYDLCQHISAMTGVHEVKSELKRRCYDVDDKEGCSRVGVCRAAFGYPKSTSGLEIGRCRRVGCAYLGPCVSTGDSNRQLRAGCSFTPCEVEGASEFESADFSGYDGRNEGNTKTKVGAKEKVECDRGTDRKVEKFTGC